MGQEGGRIIGGLAQRRIEGKLWVIQVNERTQNFQDLVWGRSGRSFDLAIEAKIPKNLREKLANQEFSIIRTRYPWNSIPIPMRCPSWQKRRS